MVRIGGIDYSLTSPSICIYNGDENKFNFDKCNIFFLSKTKKYSNYSHKNIDGQENYSDFSCPEQRYDFISDWAMDILISNDIQKITLEDYSYGSTGKVFHIAENTGLLKWKLWQSEIKIEVVAPTAVKKFASGKGNADKERMYESFLEETSRNLNEELESKSKKIGNPISDIVDSYYICKMGLVTA
jgi:Holliday junction resolvasome RuvABC endonuclease subunit